MLHLSGRGDSNARPPRPERGALPTALLPVIWWQCGVRTHVNWCHKPAPQPLGQLSRGLRRIRTTNACLFRATLYRWSYQSIVWSGCDSNARPLVYQTSAAEPSELPDHCGSGGIRTHTIIILNDACIPVPSPSHLRG